MRLRSVRRSTGFGNIALRGVVLALANASLIPLAWSAPTKLTDQPILTTINLPANVVLQLSVEFPTADSVAFPADFAASTRYDGYFDPLKCYSYNSGQGYFERSGAAAADYSCSGAWSGTFLNWATMQTIDLFRWAMTGGYRKVDYPANASDPKSPLTILQRAYASNQGNGSNFPERKISQALAAKHTPYANKGWLFIGNMKNKGLKFEIWANNVYEKMFAAVKVCDPAYPEKNCHPYKYTTGGLIKTVYKPEGLMQANRDAMLFTDLGYIYEDRATAHGGVLRARARHIMGPGDANFAPSIARSGVDIYEVAEISDTGAFIPNPDVQDAQNSKAGQVTASGAMNYLNGFGFAASNYMTHDSVSLLYAEALKYLRGKTPTGDYTASLTSGQQDGFPVIYNWKDPVIGGSKNYDPILRWCQKNFFVGIGDVNNSYDNRLPGGKSPIPSDADSTMLPHLTAHAWTNEVGSKEGDLAGLGSRWGNLVGLFSGYNYESQALSAGTQCCTDNSYYIAGMAYYANTQDIRPDLTKPEGKKTTVQTYWVDVLEWQEYKHRNQYWLATKYGGFVDSNDNNLPDLDSEWKSATKIANTFEIPKTYFPAADAAMMVTGLTQAFKQIRETIGEQAGVGVSSPALTLGTGAAATKIFQVTYDSTKGWGGTVKGMNIESIAEDGTVNTTTLFNTDTRFYTGADLNAAPANWAENRIIATGNWTAGVFTPTPFKWTNLTADQQAALIPSGGSEADGQNVLNYLRGDKTLEGATFRTRTKPLGDIVDSQAVYLGASLSSYNEEYNLGYKDYSRDKAGRPGVIFVGANDGMLHAIDANNGKGLWAYVPSFLFQGPSSPATPAVDGLQALSSPNYYHHNYVNATPYIADVDFANTGGSHGSGDWHTLLVGGLGKGGRGYYAIDVSDPISDVNGLTNAVKWEFTDLDMGFSYGRPVIVKSPRWGWVVILTGGYNNIGATATHPGAGVIYILNAKTGALHQKIYTPAGSATDPAGLAHVSAFVPDYADYTALNVYGGDLLGNVWRFDLSSPTADVPTPSSAFALLRDGSGVAQPVTTEPQVEYESGNLRRWVFVGTGKLLHADDSGTTQTQTFYALRDGMRAQAWESGAMPAGFGLPIQRSTLRAVSDSDLKTGVTLSATTPLGWYHDLTGLDGGGSERVIINPLAFPGADVITWVGAIPTNDPCSPGGTARYYQTDFASGHSLLLDASLAPISYLASSEQWMGHVIVKSGITTTALYTTASTAIKTTKNYASDIKRPQLFNWRLIGQ